MEADYRLFTVVAVAWEAKSLRHAKKMIRARGLARSNLMHHPLRKKPRDERQKIMQAQRDLIRWCFEKLHSAKQEAA